MKNREEHISKDGIDIYSYRNESLHGFQLSLFVRSGSMHETPSECGISHFFEHVAIRNVNKLMGGALYSALDLHGVEFNASTYSEMTQFYVGGASKNFRFAIEVLLKIFSPILLSQEEISAERSRIKAEIRESDERTSLSAFTAERVHGGTSLAGSITGTVGSINKIGRGMLEEFRHRVLTKKNIFFYLTGNVSDEDILYLSRLVGELGLSEGKKYENIAPVSSYFGKRVPEVHIKNADFTVVRFTFDLNMPTLSLAEADLIYEMLLGGYNSEFFIELSERRGLFYDISGALERYLNAGTLSFSFEVKGAALYESVLQTVKILKRMKREPPSPEKCIRATYVDNACLLLDDVRDLNFTFAYDNHIMDASYADMDERVRAYTEVSPSRIQALCSEIFSLKNLTFTMKGSKKRTDTERLLSILKSLDE